LLDIGNVTNAVGPTGGTSMLVIQRMDPIYADFTVTEADLPTVRQHMAAGALQVQVRLPQDQTAVAIMPPGTQPMLPGPTGTPTSPQAMTPRAGELTFMDNNVDNGSGTIKLRATIPNADRHFWPGQFVHVRLVLQTKKNAVLVPNRAPQISQQGPYLFVVKPDGTAELRLVVLGQRQGDLTVIEKGLEAGEPVVTTGQLAVIPGATVRVEAPGENPASPGHTDAKSAGSGEPK
jgi:multidrug efflux system membrane fusion protein